MSRWAAQLHGNSRKLKFPCRIWDNVPFLKVRHHLQCVNIEVQTWASLVLHGGSSFLIPKENVLFNNCNITDLSQQPVDWLYNLSLCCSIVCLHSACVLDTNLTQWEESARVDLWNKNCKTFELLGMPVLQRRFLKRNELSIKEKNITKQQQPQQQKT